VADVAEAFAIVDTKSANTFGNPSFHGDDLTGLSFSITPLIKHYRRTIMADGNAPRSIMSSYTLRLARVSRKYTSAVAELRISPSERRFLAETPN
jgi:hypothetical protein